MQVSLMPEAAAEDGEVNYRLSLDDALAAEKAMSSSGIAATPAGKLKLPPRRIPQEKKPVKIHCHTRIFCVGEISAVRSTFECRFDLYVHWPEQVKQKDVIHELVSETVTLLLPQGVGPLHCSVF